MSRSQRSIAFLIRQFVFTASLVYASAVQAALVASEDSLVGIWYGEAGAANQPISQRFVLTLNRNGTFSTRVRAFDTGRAQGDVNNSGLWGVSNGLFFTFTLMIDGQKVDPKWPSVSNPYLVRSVTAETFSYQHIPSGNTFLVKRVGAGYSIPN